MTSLKTLKDIEITFPIGGPIVYSDELKSEAIKWVKFLMYPVVPIRNKGMRRDMLAQAHILQHFFNLTEEEMK